MSEYSVAGVEFDSPVINAAGSINGTSVDLIIREVNELSETAIGAITVGSITIPKRAGNGANGGTVYYHDPKTGRTYNSMGLPNIGAKAAVEEADRIIDAADGKAVIFSVSPVQEAGKDYGTSVEQSIELIGHFMEVIRKYDNALIELNVSCPNIVTEDGGRKPIMGLDLETMHELAYDLSSAVGYVQKLGLKLPPYMSDEEKVQIPRLAKILTSKPVFGFLVTCNTIRDQVPKDRFGAPILSVPGGKGGMSGPATKEVGREQLELWRQVMPEIDIISTQGVNSGEEVKARLELGAKAAGGVTFLWEAKNRKARVTDLVFDAV